MANKKRNTNYTSNKKITIEEIFDKKNKETQLYRDILKYISPIVENSILGHDDAKNIRSSTFNIWDLSMWLVKKNRQLQKEYEDSPKTSYSNRAHSKGTLITNRVEKLTELGILSKMPKKGLSKKNKVPTDLYCVTATGNLITLTLNLSNYLPESEKHKKILKFLLYRWIESIPEGYRSGINDYYRILKYFLEVCIENHGEVVFNFIEIMQDTHTSQFNFSDFRNKINYVFFKKILDDLDFQLFFYKFMLATNLNSIFEKELGISMSREYIRDMLNLLGYQFKIDVENKIEWLVNRNLDTRPEYRKEGQWMNKNNKRDITLGAIDQEENSKQIQSEIVLDFDIKRQWEEERIHHLSNKNVIAILVKCLKCSNIYPSPFKIEKDSINKLSCKKCSNALELYDFDKEYWNSYGVLRWKIKPV